MPFDDLAARLSAEYSLFLYALNGRYQEIRAPGVTVTPRAVSDLDRTARELAQTLYGIAEREIDDYLRPMIQEASDDVADGLVVRKKVVLSHVRASLLENVHQVVKTARTGITGPGDMLRGATGAIGLLMQRQAGKIQFRTTDTSGRKWDALKLFKVFVRDFAYQAWLDTEAAALWAAGGDQLVTNGINAVFALRDFETVRANYFHINSSAVLSPYVPS